MTTSPGPAIDPALPSGAQWRISAEGYEATVVEVGGGLRTLRHEGSDLIHGYADDAMADAARGHVLAPWPNRIAGGRYSFRGRDFILPLTEPERLNASHGLVRWASWHLVDRRDDALTVATALHPQPGWAWTLGLRITYSLDASGLTITPSATNLSDSACPFGFGMHPYLTAGEANLDDAALTLPAHTQVDVDDRLIPTGRHAITPFDETSLDGISLDTCFTDLTTGTDDSRWQVSLSTPDRTTTLWADAAGYPYVQAFTGDGLPAPANRRSGLAVEPMTCPANAFVSGEGLITLDPDETWSAPFGISSSMSRGAPDRN